MPYLPTPCGPIFYLSRGESSPVLLALHGAGGTSRHWGYQLAALHTTARVIALDLPGHGRSPGVPPQTIPELAACVLGCLDSLDLDRVVLLGHSMGGAIAQWLALHHPQRVGGLVLIATGARIRVPAHILERLSSDWTATTRWIVEMAYPPGTPAPILDAATTELRRTDPLALDADYRACAAFDLTADLHRISKPALVIAGKYDRLTTADESQALTRMLPESQLIAVPRAGHLPMIEQPNAVNVAIRAFVTELVGKR